MFLKLVQLQSNTIRYLIISLFNSLAKLDNKRVLKLKVFFMKSPWPLPCAYKSVSGYTESAGDLTEAGRRWDRHFTKNTLEIQ